jgi:hypothetical protein
LTARQMPDEEDMDEATKAAHRLNYDTAANDPLAWAIVADNLVLAARLLEPHFRLDFTEEDVDRYITGARIQGPILMLRGCGLECLLKALYVAKGNKLGRDGRYVSPGGKDHDLVNLAEKAAFSMTPSEAALVGYLDDYITIGRYPVAKRAPEAYPMLADGRRRNVQWSEHDEAGYEPLRKRLREEVVRVVRERDESKPA